MGLARGNSVERQHPCAKPSSCQQKRARNLQVQVYKNHSTTASRKPDLQLDAAYQLADDWAGSIMDAAREPELYRFVVQATRQCSLDLAGAKRAAAYFNRPDLNLIPPLPESVVEEKATAAWEDVASDQVQRKPSAGKTEDYSHICPFNPAIIRLAPEELTRQADEVEIAMLLDPDSDPIMSHAGRYAAVRGNRSLSVREKMSGESRPEIVHFNEPALRERMMASAKFFSLRKDKWVATKAPDDLVKTLIARNGGTAPSLTGLLLAPTVCPNGRTIEHPGHDDATGLYAAFEHGSFPKLRQYLTMHLIDNPDWRTDLPRRDVAAVRTAMAERDADLVEYQDQRHTSERQRAQRDATAAYRWLAGEVFGEFPFKHRVDQSAAVAALLTGLVRKTCGPAPAFLISAPQQSTGKTALASVIALATEGAVSGLNSWPEKEEELEKILFAALRSGQTTIVFDNLRNGILLRSDKLAKFLTAEVFQGRILGLSELATLPSNALVLLTGNNVTLEGDMASRIIEIYLDAHDERPDQRTFKRNIIDWTTANRGAIVEKALTIVKAYLDCGAPTISGKPTRFATWDSMVRRAIKWAGGEDVGAKFDRAHECDPGLVQLRDVMRTWQPALGDDPVTAGDIAAKIEASDFKAEISDFRKALHALLSVRRGSSIDGKAIGMGLMKHANRALDGLRIVSRHDQHLKQNIWMIDQTGTAIDPVF